MRLLLDRCASTGLKLLDNNGWDADRLDVPARSARWDVIASGVVSAVEPPFLQRLCAA